MDFRPYGWATGPWELIDSSRAILSLRNGLITSAINLLIPVKTHYKNVHNIRVRSFPGEIAKGAEATVLVSESHKANWNICKKSETSFRLMTPMAARR
jgi:hypothetical protein